MQVSLFTALILIVLTALAFLVGRRRAIQVSQAQPARLHSLPNYYGYYIALWTGAPAFLLLMLYAMFGNDLVDSLALSQAERAAEPLQARFERVVEADPALGELRDERSSLQARIETSDGQSGQSVSDLTAERRAVESRIDERRRALAEALAEQAADPLARAGFEYRQLGPERRQLFVGDARAMAFQDGVPSRDTAAERALATAMAPYDGLLKGAAGLGALALAIGGLTYARSRISLGFRARNRVERVISWVLLLASVIAVATTVGIVLSLLFESIRFFAAIDWKIHEFLFGTQWSPQIAIREGQVGQSGAFGAVPLFAGTFLITLIAMIVAVPVGLFAAIYLSEYAGPNLRAWAKPVLEILAGIPTVVYGFFALLTVGPLLREALLVLGYENAVTQSALAAGLVMGVMIIPFVSSLADDVINAVPQSLRDGAYAMGATKSETVRQVIIPAALPGIVGAVLLAVSRAVGETMIVVMAAGQGANLTANPLESVTTITVQIVMLLTGDQEFDSPKTLSAFALGLVLFVLTLILNIIALRVVQRYREKYD